MRKLLLIVVALSLGTFALGQMAGSNSVAGETQGNDWYNQHLAAQVQQYDRIAGATAASITTQESQSGALPASMAANAGATGNDWYNQRLAAQVREFQRIAAANAAQTASSPEQ